MALSYPLSLADFFNTLSLVRATMTLDSAVLTSETGGGEVLTSAIGTRLWRGRIEARGHAYINLDNVTARLELLRQSGASFLIRPAWRAGPQSDPTGSILGGATPTITAVNANNRDVTIGGLPVGYQIKRGDLVSFTYLTSPTRYALHEFVGDGTANGSGNISSIEVMPPVRTGYSLPVSITLVNPRCKAVLMPDSYEPPAVAQNGVAFFAFEWRQTLR
jgi:hypothetical protein